MKKKHLKSLETIQHWLFQQGEESMALKEAFEIIRCALQEMPDGPKEMSSTVVLPPPQEIGNDPGTLAVYSDGGCRGNPGPGAYAFVIQGASGKILAEGVEYEAQTTNNRMELTGPLKALRELLEVLPAMDMNPQKSKVKVMTDSKYVVEGMRSWVKGWKARGWKKADNKTPENLVLWQELDEVRTQFLEVEWIWIKGHAGHPQNEYCDKKANEVMDAHSPS